MLFLLALACATGPAAPEATPAASPEAAAPAAAAPEAAAAPAAPEAAGNVNLGEAFTDTEVVPVDTLVAQAASYDGKPVVLDGVVKEVCQKKGCWHTIATADPAVNLMVKDKEYAVFLPRDAAGKHVHVKGTFAVESMPEDEARHYAEDAGRDPSAIHGPQKTYALDVSGVRFVPS